MVIAIEFREVEGAAGGVLSLCLHSMHEANRRSIRRGTHLCSVYGQAKGTRLTFSHRHAAGVIPASTAPLPW